MKAHNVQHFQQGQSPYKTMGVGQYREFGVGTIIKLLKPVLAIQDQAEGWEMKWKVSDTFAMPKRKTNVAQKLLSVGETFEKTSTGDFEQYGGGWIIGEEFLINNREIFKVIDMK